MEHPVGIFTYSLNVSITDWPFPLHRILSFDLVDPSHLQHGLLFILFDATSVPGKAAGMRSEDIAEVGTYTRKQENKKKREHALDQEYDAKVSFLSFLLSCLFL